MENPITPKETLTIINKFLKNNAFTYETIEMLFRTLIECKEHSLYNQDLDKQLYPYYQEKTDKVLNLFTISTKNYKLLERYSSDLHHEICYRNYEILLSNKKCETDAIIFRHKVDSIIKNPQAAEQDIDTTTQLMLTNLEATYSCYKMTKDLIDCQANFLGNSNAECNENALIFFDSLIEFNFTSFAYFD
jgi:hypothetical protein